MSQFEPCEKWIRKVSNVFNTSPRNGENKKTIWLERSGASRKFEQVLWQPGAHICVDGPTGSGKTSLVKTELYRHKTSHIEIQTTKNMNWIDFCRQMIYGELTDNHSISGGLETGISNGLPTFKVSLSMTHNLDPLSRAKLAETLSRTWTEYDVANALINDKIALFIDDLERANDELICRISDLCKILVQRNSLPQVTLILVGSGDLFQKIYNENSSLDERLVQLSLGALTTSGQSVHFVRKGLEKLNLRHPWNSIYKEEQNMKTECGRMIWEAADGLPKSLNFLGKKIAFRGDGRTGVSANDIKSECEEMCQRHWREVGHRFDSVLQYLMRSPVAIAVSKVFYHDGIAIIHQVDDIKMKVDSSLASEVDNAIEKLCELDFLFKTGKNGEIVFTRHPGPAHTLGVFFRDPARFSTHSSKHNYKISSAFPEQEYKDDDGFADEQYDI